MCPSVQSLPIELTDAIIDEVEAFSDKPTRSETLSSLALTSHAFRRRVCTHRFREIVIVRTYHVEMFAALLNTDLWSNDEQLDACIRDVSILLIGPQRRLYPVVNGTHMEGILGRIFRRYPRDQAAAVTLYFAWDVKVQWEAYQFPWDWAHLNDNFRRAFLSMIQKSYLTELVIFSLDNVPRDLVHGCRIPILQFAYVKFSPSSDLDKSAEGILDSWHLEHINKFTTNHSTSPIDYVGTVAYHASPSTPIFPNLKKLICCICNDEEYEMTVALMQRATMLETLALELPEPTKRTKHLSYNHLLNLKTLGLTYYNPLRPLAPDYQELVYNIVDVFMPTIPSVPELTLSVPILSMNEFSTDLKLIFIHHDFSAIDDSLANSLPPTLEFLQIHIDVVVSASALDECDFFTNEFEKTGRRYARRFFPRLSKLPFFYITTKAVVCRDIDEQHYSSRPDYKWKYPPGIIID